MTLLRSSRPSTRLQPVTVNTVGNGATNVEPPIATRLTQEDQDDADEKAIRESVHSLVQTWTDSLQLISVITTFFVATEASLLVIAVPSSNDIPSLSTLGKLSNVGFMSALIVHIHAAIISFLGAFFLIRYRLTVAEKEEAEAEKNLVDSPKPISLNHLEKAGGSGTSHTDDLRTYPVNGRVRVSSALSGNQIIWSTNPHLVQVGPFQGQPPTQLLARCYSLCILLSFTGFLLALIGAISFAWDRLPRSISIFTSISTFLCLAAAILILIVPSTKTSHIYYNPKSR